MPELRDARLAVLREALRRVSAEEEQYDDTFLAGRNAAAQAIEKMIEEEASCPTHD
jgi:hypothetical protein